MRTQLQSHGFSRFGVFAPHEMAAITLAPFPFPGWSARLQIPPSPCRRALMNASILIATSLQDSSVYSSRRGHSGERATRRELGGLRCAPSPTWRAPRPGGLVVKANRSWCCWRGGESDLNGRLLLISLRGVWCVTEIPRCSQARPWGLE